MSTTIRVNEATRDRIAALANATHRPMTAILDEALDALERRRFFSAFNQRYRELRQDDAAWPKIEAEREMEAHALPDRSS